MRRISIEPLRLNSHQTIHYGGYILKKSPGDVNFVTTNCLCDINFLLIISKRRYTTSLTDYLFIVKHFNEYIYYYNSVTLWDRFKKNFTFNIMNYSWLFFLQICQNEQSFTSAYSELLKSPLLSFVTHVMILFTVSLHMKFCSTQSLMTKSGRPSTWLSFKYTFWPEPITDLAAYSQISEQWYNEGFIRKIVWNAEQIVLVKKSAVSFLQLLQAIL